VAFIGRGANLLAVIPAAGAARPSRFSGWFGFIGMENEDGNSGMKQYTLGLPPRLRPLTEFNVLETSR
jgi:hypothetical protein